MSKKQKLFARILNNQKNVRFSELITLIEAFDFQLDRISGSHRVYKHPNVENAFLVLQPDKSGQAKPYQIKQFLALIEEHNLSMTSSDSEGTD